MVVDCWGTGVAQTAVGPACNMADSFLQGAEIGGGLVARAMEHRRQNALLPLQIQEAQDRLHMNALNFEEAQYHRDIEIQTKEGNTAVAAWAAKPHDWGSDQTMSEFVGLTQTHPMAIKSPAGQLAVSNMEKARAAKNTLERTVEIQNLIAERMAERDAARAESERAKLENARLLKEMDVQGKLQVEDKRTEREVSRHQGVIEGRIGRELNKAEEIGLRSMLADFDKSEFLKKLDPAVRESRKLKLVAAFQDRMRKNLPPPTIDEQGNITDEPSADAAPAATPPPRLGKKLGTFNPKTGKFE